MLSLYGQSDFSLIRVLADRRVVFAPAVRGKLLHVLRPYAAVKVEPTAADNARHLVLLRHRAHGRCIVAVRRDDRAERRLLLFGKRNRPGKRGDAGGNRDGIGGLLVTEPVALYLFDRAVKRVCNQRGERAVAVFQVLRQKLRIRRRTPSAQIDLHAFDLFRSGRMVQHSIRYRGRPDPQQHRHDDGQPDKQRRGCQQIFKLFRRHQLIGEIDERGQEKHRHGQRKIVSVKFKDVTVARKGGKSQNRKKRQRDRTAVDVLQRARRRVQARHLGAAPAVQRQPRREIDQRKDDRIQISRRKQDVPCAVPREHGEDDRHRRCRDVISRIEKERHLRDRYDPRLFTDDRAGKGHDKAGQKQNEKRQHEVGELRPRNADRDRRAACDEQGADGEIAE